MAKKKMVVADSEKMPWKPFEHPKLPKGTLVKLLRTEDDTGGATLLFKVDKGFHEDKHKHPSDCDWMILEGKMIDKQGNENKRGTYVFVPAGVEHGPYSAPEGAILFLHFYGPAW
jgi:mannose-6-phosphate isomerase-like protein (cupin superfamily)